MGSDEGEALKVERCKKNVSKILIRVIIFFIIIIIFFVCMCEKHILTTLKNVLFIYLKTLLEV